MNVQRETDAAPYGLDGVDVFKLSSSVIVRREAAPHRPCFCGDL